MTSLENKILGKPNVTSQLYLLLKQITFLSYSFHHYLFLSLSLLSLFLSLSLSLSLSLFGSIYLSLSGSDALAQCLTGDSSPVSFLKSVVVASIGSFPLLFLVSLLHELSLPSSIS